MAASASSSSLNMTMILSIENAKQDLASGSPIQKCRALEDLGKLGRRAGPDALIAVTACLEDGDWCVKCAAVKALAQLAENGDEQAITAVTAQLEDDDEDVRRAAAEALAHLER
eukprot:gnl/TRDRNA2_/TRDRNA2_175742_c5_seq2.p1 gnl/TRDRNA2_/TRDRNA2_175742_c5~~gnl/TRDRNA2_/TRDRNA2_175742_c5_seq2.p1  ORF type:complete len:114 (-),score=28.03 gnl/TRDRNA2_/TRDRNA2_175742_c5_seq2:212-553(-)